jgi:plastocyanin
MRRGLAIAALAISLAGGGGAASKAAPHAHRASVAVGVAEREWGISAYRTRVRPGRLRFNITNFGEDAHNLQIRGPKGYRSPVTADINAHEHVTLAVTLRRQGVYRLICTKPGHVKLGMRASIRVKR